MREIRTLRLTGRELETDPRRWPHGHEAGNGGHGQAEAYGAPRQLSTLPPLLAWRGHCPKRRKEGNGELT